MKNAIGVWRVYGIDGNNLSMTYNPSIVLDNSTDYDLNIVKVLNADKTFNHEYSVVIIERNTANQCFEEMQHQLKNGIFKNEAHGKVELIMFTKETERK